MNLIDIDMFDRRFPHVFEEGTVYELTDDFIEFLKKEAKVEAIPIDWLLTTGMMMVGNESRSELLKVITYWKGAENE